MWLLMQLLIGISTNRYLPAMGTAGFERLEVSGYNRLPAPPPRITATTAFDILVIWAIYRKLAIDNYFVHAAPYLQER
jgi:hypothetical protein